MLLASLYFSKYVVPWKRNVALYSFNTYFLTSVIIFILVCFQNIFLICWNDYLVFGFLHIFLFSFWIFSFSYELVIITFSATHIFGFVFAFEFFFIVHINFICFYHLLCIPAHPLYSRNGKTILWREKIEQK